MKKSQPSTEALKTDLYELTMAAGYLQNDVRLTGTFELSCHTMPPNRSYLVTAGLKQLIEYILNLRFSSDDIRFIKSLPLFKKAWPEFFAYLKKFRFTGDVFALPEGEIYFAREPILQVHAPIIEAQILETYLLSITNIESLVATKASRVVAAAQGRGVIDFGFRRAHGPQAGIWAARAAFLAGAAGTSNVYAAREFQIPVFGTMAHSWVEAFDSEEEAFANYYKTFPNDTALLIDTYDTLKAAQKLARLPFAKNVKAVRLDSGDLRVLSARVRKILDQSGLKHIKIIASGNLNEFKIQELVRSSAPIDIFGVGTEMVTSRDYPALDLTYKLVQTQDPQGHIYLKAKRSIGKETLPGRKQIFRRFQKGKFADDVLGLFTEKGPGPGLLKKVIGAGKLLKALPSLEESRRFHQRRLSQLPAEFFNLSKSNLYGVRLSSKISDLPRRVE